MPCPSAFAGIVAFAKLAARPGAPFVNVAMRAFADLAAKCGATRGRVVGATQPGRVVVDDIGEAIRHRSSVLQQFRDREINAKTGAAGAAGLAVRHHRLNESDNAFSQAADLPTARFANRSGCRVAWQS